METQHRREWEALEREARAWLETPASRPGVHAELHAVVLPSFEDGHAATLAMPLAHSGAAPLGVRRAWRRALDLAKVESPTARLKHGRRLEPTLEERDVALSREAADELMRCATQLRVPAHVSAGVSLDGVVRILRLGTPFSAARFAWNGDPPPGWEDLAELARELAALIESKLA
jgi:hypothetical protein